MFNRLVLTFATAVSLIGLYALYSVAMDRVVVIAIPPQQAVEEFTEAERPAENVRVAATYIPARRWATATKSKYMLRAEQAFVYTDSWYREEGSGKHIKFIPFAMVWVSINKEGQEQAVSIVCDSAQLEFASAFDETNQKPGRVVGAVLNGAVEITGPDGLAINGHQFIFSEAGLSLLTTNPVSFRYQNHRGSATRMSMKLLAAEGLPGLDRPHVFGVESVRLIGGPNPSDPNNMYVRLKIELPDDPKPVNVQCYGDLEYSVDTNTAVFTKDVRVSHGVTQGKEKAYDSLNCETLTMQFIPRKMEIDDSSDGTAENKEISGKPAEYQKVERNLEFSWLEAVGAPGKKVQIHSDAQKMTAHLSRLTFNAESRVLTMSSEGARDNVQIRRERSELLAPKIEAQFGEMNSLETLICRGMGHLKMVDEKTGKLAFVATWRKQLTKRTDEATKLDLVQLDSGAHFLLRDRLTGLGAELIKVWLVPTANSGNMMFGTSTPDRDDAKASSPETPQPKRLLAQHEVVLESPEMMIERTNELDIQFVDVPRVSDGSLGPPIEIPYEGKSSAPSRITRNNSAAPIVVSADRIGVQLRRTEGSTQPASISEGHFEGKVRVTQVRQKGEKPLSLEGDRVDLQNEADKQEVVHLHGKPAFIRDRGYEIEGKDIYLDRGKNRAWVSSSGAVKVPVPPETNIPGLDANANRDLRIRWDESMNFDGLDAKFLGRVEAKLGLGTMRCEQMVVQLTERISFQSESFDTTPSINTIHCHENVKFENSTYLNKKVIDTYRGHVSEFLLNLAKGEVTAQGPGFVQAWQRQQKEGGGFATQDAIQANRPIAVEVAVWDYTRAQFEGKLRGSFDGQATGRTTRRRATIDDRVEVIHGPVEQPLEEINPDKLPSRAGTIRCDQLQLVNHLVSEKNAKEYRELVGLGNAEVEGQVRGQWFNASADEISFDGSKNQYVMRAHGKHLVRLSGDGINQVTGQTGGAWVRFNPETRKLEINGATDGAGSR